MVGRSFFILRLIGLSKSFGRGEERVEVLKDVTLSLPSKGLYTIMGKSGSGKSTLLSLLALFEKPDSGSIYLGKKEVTKWRGEKAAKYRNREIGFLFQHYNLLGDYDVMDNILFPYLLSGGGKGKGTKRATALLKDVGLSDKAKKKPDALSGGERQRVALCRALINEPSILIADEPTGALDEENAKGVMELLKKESQERLVILVTHNEELAKEYSDAVYVLKGGRLHQEGEMNPSGDVPKRKRRGHRKTSFGKVMGRNLREDGIGNVFALLLSFVSFFLLYCCIGLNEGYVEAVAAKRYEYPDCGLAYMSAKESLPIEDSPLNLVRTMRPEYEEAAMTFGAMEGVSVELDYSYFFPGYSSYSYGEDTIGPFETVPLFDLSMSNLGSHRPSFRGRLPGKPSLDVCLINEALHQEAGVDIGERLSFRYDFTYQENDLSEDLSYEMDFTVAAIVSESDYLSSPRVYYSYYALRDYFSEFRLGEGFAYETAEEAVREAEGSDPVSGYRYLLYCHQEGVLPSFWDKIEEIDEEVAFGVDCFALVAAVSYGDIFSSMVALLPFFVGVAFLSSGFLLFSLAHSRFSRRKKEAAVLCCLGESGSECLSPYVGESLMCLLPGALLAYGAAYRYEGLVNNFVLDGFGLRDAVTIPFASYFGIPHLLILGSVLICLFIAYAAVYLSGLDILRGRLFSELRDE